jgi:hypothetical protein
MVRSPHQADAGDHGVLASDAGAAWRAPLLIGRFSENAMSITTMVSAPSTISPAAATRRRLSSQPAGVVDGVSPGFELPQSTARSKTGNHRVSSSRRRGDSKQE